MVIAKIMSTMRVENMKESFSEPVFSVGEHKEGNPDGYTSLIGILFYLSVLTRLDITCSVGILSKFVERLTSLRCVAAKHVSRCQQ